MQYEVAVITGPATGNGEGRRELARALERDPRLAPEFSLAHLSLAKALALAGDLQAAEGEFEAALAGDAPMAERSRPEGFA